MNIITQTENIYNHLCDGLSRKIYENRLLYNLTRNNSFMNNIVSLSFDESVIKEYKNTLNTFLEKYNNRDIIVYGAGYIGNTLITLCDKTKLAAFCDSDTKKQGNVLGGYKIISPEKLKQEYSCAVVIVAVSDDEDVIEITENLVNMGFEKDSVFNIKYVYKLFNDHARNLGKAQYFDPDIILSRILKDEIFIDVGCCNCFTDINFAKNCDNEYKEIIAFEPNPKQYPICVENSKSIKNITIHPYGLWNQNTELYFDNSGGPGIGHISDVKDNCVKIKTVMLDDILDGDKATFIKLDVEGAELNALKGAERTILKYRPKLAICIYHKPEDIWEIPEYILSLHDDYKLYIRHYGFNATETVLYAV